MNTHLMFVMAIVLVLSGCGGMKTIVMEGRKVDVPEWVTGGTPKDASPGVINGVGFANLQDSDMSQGQADENAVRRVAFNLYRDIDLVWRQKSELRNNNKDLLTSLDNLTRSKLGIEGIEIIKRYVSADGTWYSLAMFDKNKNGNAFKLKELQ